MKKISKLIISLGLLSSINWVSAAGIGFPDGSVQRQSAIPENVIMVTAGDSIATALADTVGASANNPYVVQVGPGVFNEGANLLTVRPYVHLRGSGENVTFINVTRRSSSFALNDRAALDLKGNGRISDLTLSNTSIGSGVAYAVISSEDGGVIEHAHIKASGGGTGGGNYAVYSNNANLLIESSRLTAYGRTGFNSAVNAALGVVGPASGGYTLMTVKDSDLFGGSASEPTLSQRDSCAGSGGTGFGIQGVRSRPIVINSRICGEHRGVVSNTNGIHNIYQSRVKTSGNSSAYLIETSGGGTVNFIGSELNALLPSKLETGTGNGANCVYSKGPGMTNLNSACN